MCLSQGFSDWNFMFCFAHRRDGRRGHFVGVVTCCACLYQYASYHACLLYAPSPSPRTWPSHLAAARAHTPPAFCPLPQYMSSCTLLVSCHTCVPALTFVSTRFTFLAGTFYSQQPTPLWPHSACRLLYNLHPSTLPTHCHLHTVPCLAVLCAMHFAGNRHTTFSFLPCCVLPRLAGHPKLCCPLPPSLFTSPPFSRLLLCFYFLPFSVPVLSHLYVMVPGGFSPLFGRFNIYVGWDCARHPLPYYIYNPLWCFIQGLIFAFCFLLGKRHFGAFVWAGMQEDSVAGQYLSLSHGMPALCSSSSGGGQVDVVHHVSVSSLCLVL